MRSKLVRKRTKKTFSFSVVSVLKLYSYHNRLSPEAGMRDALVGPVVKNLSCNAGDVGLIPD